MPMTASARVSEINPSISIVSLSGRLGVQTQEELSTTLSQALEQCDGGVLLDMSAVDFVSSAGLRALMVAYKQAQSTGKKMAMIQVRPAVYKIFKLTSFEAIFNIFESEAAAMKSL